MVFLASFPNGVQISQGVTQGLHAKVDGITEDTGYRLGLGQCQDHQTVMGLDGAQANPGCQDCGPRARTVEEGPYCLLQGIGRRKDLERLWKRHTFLRWAPCELELSQQPPLESSYQIDFPSGTGLTRLPQRLVHFVQVQPPYANTTYQHNFCRSSQSGRCGSAKVRPQEPVAETLPDLPGIPRPKLLQHYLHAGVSECLNWSQALNRVS